MICEKCGQEINANASFCEYCGANVKQEAKAHPAAQAIMGQPVAQYSGPAVEEKVKKKNVPLGILGALVGAVLGGASIVLFDMLGLVAALSGLILALCTIKGYELLGGKPGVPGLIFCTLLILVTPWLANQVNLALEIMEYFDGATFSQALSAIPAMMESGAIDMSVYWMSLGQLYLFAALGGVSTVWNAFKNK